MDEKSDSKKHLNVRTPATEKNPEPEESKPQEASVQLSPVK